MAGVGNDPTYYYPREIATPKPWTNGEADDTKLLGPTKSGGLSGAEATPLEDKAEKRSYSWTSAE